MGHRTGVNQMVLARAAFGRRGAYLPAAAQGLVSFVQGPIAKATNYTDFSWLAGLVVSGGLYYVLRPFLVKEAAPQAAPIV
jgi:purine-cytosine permease-like protein